MSVSGTQKTWHDKLIDAARPHLKPKFHLPVFYYEDGTVEADPGGDYIDRGQVSRRAVHQANRREAVRRIHAVYIVKHEGERLLVYSSAHREDKVGGRWRTVPTWFEDGPLHIARVATFESYVRPRLSSLAG